LVPALILIVHGLIHLFQIRSAYRTVELSEGFNGHLATSEGFFYGLDTFPLLLAIGIYVPFWPGQFITGPHLSEDNETAAEEVTTSSRGTAEKEK